ncbi:MAG: iron-only hydrogenase system regulator [Eubacterium sp.]|nr:iron-only hydrogenase system regulator [Eubacterium sp.]
METKAAIIAIIVKDVKSSTEINAVLHEYNDCIIGRMGIPYRTKGINIISIAVDADMDTINTMAGRIGRIEGVSAKTVY